MENHIERFNKLWNDDFITSFRGALIRESAKQSLSYSLVKLLLDEKKLQWTLDTEMCGRWLVNYEKEFPEKGGQIRNVLLNDMEVTEVQVSSAGNVVKYALPLAGGAVGYATSRVLELETLGTAAATILPIAVLYPATATYLSAKRKNKVLEQINAYVSQLDKFKRAVDAILSVP